MAEDQNTKQLLLDAVEFARNKLKIEFTLKHNQREAIRNVCIERRDCLCVLPTGYGKSIIYQCLPFVFDFIRKIDNDSIVIVVSPLNAIIDEQISKLTSKGIKCAVLRNTGNLDVSNDIKIPEFSLLFTHPEMLVNNVEMQSLLKSKIYQERVVAVVVDEAHLAIQWKSFRPAYANLNILGTFLPKVPFIALTGSANKDWQMRITTSIGLLKPVLIVENLNRANIFYSVCRRPNRLNKVKEVLLPLVLELKEKLNAMPMTIVFSDLQTCAECYEICDGVLGDEQYFPKGAEKLFKNRLFAQYHAQYPNKYKICLTTGLVQGTCVARMLFVTVAFGIGVDCPDVDRVIHIGVPRSMEEFFQETGRADRKGQPASSTVYFNSYDISKNKCLDSSMQSYVGTKSCRRDVILKHFDVTMAAHHSTAHGCCDNRRLNCSCSICVASREDEALESVCVNTETLELDKFETLPGNTKLSAPEAEDLRNALLRYRMSAADETSYVGITFTTGISDHVINVALEKFTFINSAQDVDKHLPILSGKHVEKIWEIMKHFKKQCEF